MAQQDATEQAKEFLRQVIKYRFWISICIAALFATIAYFMGSAPVKAKAVKEIADIKAAESGVKKFANGGPTDAYKPIVEEKTQIVTKDVNKAWKELYDRQAPLLTWPETANRFQKWGRKWPETEDSGRVQVAFIDYGHAYPAYVEMVYRTFNPFDYETGKGIVAAPSKEALLRPAQFNDEDKPDLGKIWSAQERLWIQRTVLEVIAQVNKKATDWDSAYIKEIEALEVGNPTAQDQRSLANAEELKKAEEILAPGQASAAEAEAAAPAGGMMGNMGAAAGMGRRGGMMGGMGAMGGMGERGGGGGAGAKYDDTIYYITPANDKGQFKILPILVTVLIDQDHVQNFLVELENSPMSIQVMDFELARPSSRVVKPEKGDAPAGGGMMMMGGGMGGMMRSMMGNGGQMAFGGMMGQMRQSMDDGQRRAGCRYGHDGSDGNGDGRRLPRLSARAPISATSIRRRSARKTRRRSRKPRAPRSSIPTTISSRSRSTGRHDSSIPRPRKRPPSPAWARLRPRRIPRRHPA